MRKKRKEGEYGPFRRCPTNKRRRDAQRCPKLSFLRKKEGKEGGTGEGETTYPASRHPLKEPCGGRDEDPNFFTISSARGEKRDVVHRGFDVKTQLAKETYKRSAAFYRLDQEGKRGGEKKGRKRCSSLICPPTLQTLPPILSSILQLVYERGRGGKGKACALLALLCKWRSITNSWYGKGGRRACLFVMMGPWKGKEHVTLHHYSR